MPDWTAATFERDALERFPLSDQPDVEARRERGRRAMVAASYHLEAERLRRAEAPVVNDLDGLRKSLIHQHPTMSDEMVDQTARRIMGVDQRAQLAVEVAASHEAEAQYRAEVRASDDATWDRLFGPGAPDPFDPAVQAANVAAATAAEASGPLPFAGQGGVDGSNRGTGIRLADGTTVYGR